MIKMLFSDLDGTLLYHEGDHSADVNFENTEAIKKLEQSGVKFGVATSRSHLFLEKKMSCQHPFDTVAFNGNLVYCSGKCLDVVTFTKDEIKRIIYAIKADVEDNRSMFITKENDVVFYDIAHPRAQGYVENKLKYVQDHRYLLKEKAVDYIEHSSDQICFIIGVFPNKEICDESRQLMKEMTEIQYTDTSERTFTLTKDNRDKVTGILKIAQYYGMKEDEIAIIGDSYNDVQMMKYFKHSYCMFHSPIDIQKQAKHTVKSVADCIEHILKINKEEAHGIV